MSDAKETNELHVLAQACYVLLECLDSIRKQPVHPTDAELRKATRHVMLALDCVTVSADDVAPWVDEACTRIADTQANAIFNLTSEELAALSAGEPIETAEASTFEVQKPQRSTPPPTTERKGLQGDTSSMSISDLLTWLSLQERSGVLYVNIPDEDVAIYLENGNVVHAESNNSPKSARLGEILVDQGTLTTEQLSHVLELLKTNALCLGALVRNEGLVDAEGLQRALKEQVARLFGRLFHAERAQFWLVEDLPRSEDGKLNLSMMGLLLDAARSSDEAKVGAAAGSTETAGSTGSTESTEPTGEPTEPPAADD